MLTYVQAPTLLFNADVKKALFRVLPGIAPARPSDESELLDVSGIGPALLEKCGRALLSIVAEPR